jgi:hypothetical protein
MLRVIRRKGFLCLPLPGFTTKPMPALPSPVKSPNPPCLDNPTVGCLNRHHIGSANPFTKFLPASLLPLFQSVMGFRLRTVSPYINGTFFRPSVSATGKSTSEPLTRLVIILLTPAKEAAVAPELAVVGLEVEGMSGEEEDVLVGW